MVSLTRIGDLQEPYPMLQNIWEFFSEKSTKTIFISIGSGKSCLPDLDLAETLGCSLLKLETADALGKWKEVQEILKTRKLSDSTSEFAKVASRKWVLPRNLVLEECMPSYSEGTFKTEKGMVVTKSWEQLVRNHFTVLGIPDETLRIDIVKLDSCPHEAMILDSLWNTGFRPSLLLIHWFTNPDATTQSVNTAAHLQMLGYVLVGKEGNRYLYFYTDVNYYEVCSWETVAKKFENPLMLELIQSIYPGSDGMTVRFPLQKKES